MFEGVGYIFSLCFKLEKGYLISIVLMELLKSVNVVMSVILPKYIIDELFVKNRSDKCIFYLVLLAVTYLITGILNSYLKYYSEKKRDCFYTKFNLMYGEKMLTSDYKNLENPDFLKLREKAMKFINAYGFAGIIPISAGIFGKIITLVTISGIVINMNFFVFIAYLLISILSITVNNRAKKKSIDEDLKISEEEVKKNYLKKLTSERAYAKEIRVFNISRWILEKYKNQLTYINNLKNKRILIKNRLSVFDKFIALFQKAISYTYLIYKVFKDNMTIGSFTMYLNAIQSFNSNFISVTNLILDLNQYTKYYIPFKEFMEYKSKTQENTDRVLADNLDDYQIEFVNVSFKYPGSDKYVLKDINLTLKNNQKICVVGENGAGKSTFIKLLTRLYDPTEGSILFNGTDIKTLNYDSYVSKFSVAFQDYKLFALSVEENITTSESEADEIKLNKAVSFSDFNKVSKKLKYGLKTQVYKLFDKEGVELSGGEAQKLAIARTIYKDTPIIILDEPSSALDPISEAEIYNNIKDLSSDKTILYVSHRLSSAMSSNRIIVFKDGKVEEDGTHAQLIEKNGLYSELFNIQSEFYKDENTDLEKGVTA